MYLTHASLSTLTLKSRFDKKFQPVSSSNRALKPTHCHRSLSITGRLKSIIPSYLRSRCYAPWASYKNATHASTPSLDSSNCQSKSTHR